MQPGTRLGDRYALTELIGTGTHTGVWTGHDRVRDRPVRIKVLDPALSADPVVQQRFRRTSLEVAALDFPGVVRVLECVDHRDGDVVAVCQITEPVDGVSLERMLSEGLDLGTEDILSLIATTAWAVDDAHEAGVRHLNLKPSNLFIADGKVTVTDFGYLPVPETGPYTAAERSGEDATDRTADVYALGAIAYQCLTGAVPTGDDPAAALPADIPGAVSSLLERALTSDPQLRFASAGALATECELINHTNDVLGALLRRQQDRPGPITAAPEAEPATTEPVPAWPPIPGAQAPEPATQPRPVPEAGTAEPVPVTAASEDGRPAVRRSTEPPTHAAKPRRSRVAVLAAVAVVTVAGALVGVLTLLPDEPSGSAAADDDKPGYVEPSTTDSTSTSPSRSPSRSPEDDPVTDSSPAGSSSEEESESPNPLTTEEPGTQRPPGKVKVPDVVGDDRSDATGELREAGLEYRVVKTGEGGFECPVHDQDPKAGTSVKEGTTVTVTLRLAATEAECDSDGGDGGQTSPSSLPTGTPTPMATRPEKSHG